MNQAIKLINDIFPYVIIVLMLIASYFEYAKKNDPQVADKLKHIGTFAEWAVSLQDTLDKGNAEKLHDATKAVLQQADKSGIKITDDMARGAVEQAVAGRKQASGIMDAGKIEAGTVAGISTKKPVSEIYDDGTMVLRQPEKQAEPVSDDNAQLDDLEPKE